MRHGQQMSSIGEAARRYRSGEPAWCLNPDEHLACASRCDHSNRMIVDEAHVRRASRSKLDELGWRFQPVSARTSASFSDGVMNSSVSRGRPLRLRWKRRRSAAESSERSVPFGMY